MMGARTANGLGLSMDLHYASFNADGEKANILTPMGFGWAHSYQMYVFKQGYDLFKMSPAGLTTKYQRQGRRRGPLVATRGHQQTIVENLDGSIVITNHDQRSFRFEAIPGNPIRVAGVMPHMLTRITDRNGNVTELAYVSGLLDTVTGPYGRTIKFHYNTAKRLIRMTDPAGRDTAFTYDSAGNLNKITDPLGQVTRYTYDSRHRILKVIDRAGQVWRRQYDSAGHPIGVIDPNGDPLFSMSNTSNWATDINALFLTRQRVYVPSTTSVTDGRGNLWQYSYDNNGRILEKVAPDGTVTQYTYDAATLSSSSETDANGNTTSYDYDSKGNIIQRTDALGYTWRYEYEPAFNMISRMTDPNGRVTTYSYDGFGNRIQETDPLGQSMSWTYDLHGNRLSETDKNGHTAQYEYDALGNLVKITDALGNITSMIYDVVGNRLSRTDANGHTTTYEYDALDRKVKETDAAGFTALWNYDALNNVIAVTDRNGNATSYEYDERSRLTKMTDAIGGTETYGYDGNGNRITVTDKNNHSTQYEYDEQNRMVKTTDALGNMTILAYDGVGNLLSNTDANMHTTTYAYDALDRRTSILDAEGNLTQLGYEGNVVCLAVGCPTLGSSLLTKQTDAEGKVTYFKYDALDRKTHEIRKQTDVADIIDGDDAVTRYVYDAKGNLLSMTEPNGNALVSIYDAIDRLVQETNAAGDITSRGYDGVSNLITVTSPNGNLTSYVYDSLDRLTNAVDSLGPVASYSYDAEGNRLSELDGNGNGVTYGYDSLYRVATTTDALGAISQYVYDPVGNLLVMTDREGNQTQYGYDDINRRIEITDAIGAITGYSYDGVGNMSVITDANNHTTSYQYDGINRLILETYADGGARSYSYDGVGNVLTRTDQKGQTTQYVYDDLHRLIRRDYPVSGDDLFSYDLSGRMLSACREGGPDDLPADSCAGWLVTFNYDGANRILSAGQNGQGVAYVYDIPGRTRTLTYPGGRTVIESTDLRSRLDSIDDGASPAIVEYVYDTANRVVSRSYRNGITATYGYNANNWITSLEHRRADSSLVAGFAHAYDLEGNKSYEEKTHQPGRSEAYQYDDVYRLVDYKVGALVGTTVPVPSTQSHYDLDLLGNWNSKTTDGNTETRIHNEVNEIIDISGSSLVHDDNGNLQQDEEYSYQYDEENRLSTVIRTLDNKIVGQYEYDALSRRIQKTASPEFGIPNMDITRYFYDEARVVEEQNIVGITRATYLYGNYVDEILTMDRGPDVYFYHQKNLWSVAVITDDLGGVVEQYTYDIYGVASAYDSLGVPIPLTAWGTTSSRIDNPWLYTSRRYDTESGNYFYRSRYYAPMKGRFISRDSLGYVSGMNLYEYVASRVTFYVDPYGYRHWSVGGIGNLVDAALIAVTKKEIGNVQVAVALVPGAKEALNKLGQVFIVANAKEITCEYTRPPRVNEGGGNKIVTCTCCQLEDAKPSGEITGLSKAKGGQFTPLGGAELSVEVGVSVFDYKLIRKCLGDKAQEKKDCDNDDMNVTILYKVSLGGKVQTGPKGALTETPVEIVFSFREDYTINCETGSDAPGGKQL